MALIDDMPAAVLSGASTEHEVAEQATAAIATAAKARAKSAGVLDEIGPAVIDSTPTISDWSTGAGGLDAPPMRPGWAATRSWVSRSLLPRRRRIRRELPLFRYVGGQTLGHLLRYR